MRRRVGDSQAVYRGHNVFKKRSSVAPPKKRRKEKAPEPMKVGDRVVYKTRLVTILALPAGSKKARIRIGRWDERWVQAGKLYRPGEVAVMTEQRSGLVVAVVVEQT